MHYVYILLLDEIPIYAGMTNNPVLRFKRHYMANDCGTYFILRYFLFEKNKIVKMKLVYCCEDREEAFRWENKTITLLRQAKFSIINDGQYNITFPRLPNKGKRIPHRTFTDKLVRYIRDNQNEIHKEYGYK